EDDAQLRLIGDLLSDRVIVEIELDLRAGFQQTARAFGEKVAVLTDGELVEELACIGAVVAVGVAGGVSVDGIREQVMDDGGLAWLALDGFDVAILGKAGGD